MMTQHLLTQEAELSRSRSDARASWSTRVLLDMALHDWLIGIYFVVVLIALVAGTGPNRPVCIQRVITDLCIFGVGVGVTRGLIHPNGSFGALVSALVYRMTIFGAVFLSYFQLRDILPAVSGRAVDAQLYAFDMKVFHYEPSVAWDQFVNPTTTEWFSFFYFSYFAILIVHVLPALMCLKNEVLISQFALGIFVVFTSAHTLYMVVPGYGPYAHLASSFQHPLPNGFFWGLVRETVSAGGAQKDIFPSLHTAAPTFLAIYSFRHRKHLPFKYTWPLMAFFALQIIGATMFLRWHYLIDIFAGLTLAAFANFIGATVCPWESVRRERLGSGPIFPPLSLAFMRRGGKSARGSDTFARADID